MNRTEPELIAIRFNECINARDLDGLSRLMTDDHTFIDSADNVTRSKAAMIESWKKFFDLVPNYRNTFEMFHTDGNLVAIRGFAFWNDDNPHDPAVWTAVVEDGLVKQWRVYKDTAENRKRIGLE